MAHKTSSSFQCGSRVALWTPVLAVSPVGMIPFFCTQSDRFPFLTMGSPCWVSSMMPMATCTYLELLPKGKSLCTCIFQ